MLIKRSLMQGGNAESLLEAGHFQAPNFSLKIGEKARFDVAGFFASAIESLLAQSSSLLIMSFFVIASFIKAL